VMRYFQLTPMRAPVVQPLLNPPSLFHSRPA
jgi:hypothetical protein